MSDNEQTAGISSNDEMGGLPDHGGCEFPECPERAIEAWCCNVEEATAGQTRHQPSIEQKGTGGNTAQVDGQRDKGKEEGCARPAAHPPEYSGS